MTRRRPDHSGDMLGRSDRSKLRSRRRRRRVGRLLGRGMFWALVLTGVFVLGLGYGRTLAGDDETRRDQVTFTHEAGAIEATLPTRTETVTVTKTVTVRAVARANSRRSAPATSR